MNFKRPYWRLLFISLGCLVVGFTVWMLGKPDFKGSHSLFWILFYTGAELLILLGAVSLVASLIWMIVSEVHSLHPKR